MKNLLGKLAVLLIFCSLIFIDGCKNDETSDPSAEPSFAFLKGLDGQRLKEYDPEILELIKKDLLDNNNTNLAKRFGNTYNFKTGKLSPEASEYIESNPYSDSRAKTNALTWSMDWFSQNTSSSDIGGTAYPNAAGTVLIGAPSHWLSGFRINTPINYPSTPWAASNTFSYNASDTEGLSEYTAVNNWRIRSGWNTVKFNSYWFWVGKQIACYVYYRSLLTDNTTTGWYSNGQTLGNWSSTIGVKTIELRIVNLEAGCGA
jgi:hypothetical protein